MFKLSIAALSGFVAVTKALSVESDSMLARRKDEDLEIDPESSKGNLKWSFDIPDHDFGDDSYYSKRSGDLHDELEDEWESKRSSRSHHDKFDDSDDDSDDADDSDDLLQEDEFTERQQRKIRRRQRRFTRRNNRRRLRQERRALR